MDDQTDEAQRIALSSKLNTVEAIRIRIILEEALQRIGLLEKLPAATTKAVGSAFGSVQLLPVTDNTHLPSFLDLHDRDTDPASTAHVATLFKQEETFGEQYSEIIQQLSTLQNSVEDVTRKNQLKDQLKQCYEKFNIVRAELCRDLEQNIDIAMNEAKISKERSTIKNLLTEIICSLNEKKNIFPLIKTVRQTQAEIEYVNDLKNREHDLRKSLAVNQKILVQVNEKSNEQVKLLSDKHDSLETELSVLYNTSLLENRFFLERLANVEEIQVHELYKKERDLQVKIAEKATELKQLHITYDSVKTYMTKELDDVTKKGNAEIQAHEEKMALYAERKSRLLREIAKVRGNMSSNFSWTNQKADLSYFDEEPEIHKAREIEVSEAILKLREYARVYVETLKQIALSKKKLPKKKVKK